MRAYIPAYQLISPLSLSEALDVLAKDDGKWQPFAGGTDLMVLLESGKLPHKNYLNIWNLPELRGIEVSNEHVTLGALTTYTEVQANPILREEFPMLCQAASETGGLAIQNRGTLGGNIANASPAADSPPALLAYDAEVELVSAGGLRRVEYAEFHTGYKQTLMREDELIARVRLRRPRAGARQFYRKVGTRRAQAISKVCFAGLAELDGDVLNDVRIAVGSVAPVVMRCRRTEGLLKGRRLDGASVRGALDEIAREVVPIDDIRSTARYRRRVAQNLLEEFLSNLDGGSPRA